MIKGSYEYLKEIVGTHSCPEHPEATLVLAWHKVEGYVVRCGSGHYPEELLPQESLTSKLKRGEALPLEVAQRIEKRRQKMVETNLGFPLAEKADRGSGTALTPQQIAALINWAKELGLRAELGHCCIMYGVPYPTVDGLIYRARRLDPKCTYKLAYLNPEEQISRGLSGEDWAIECKVFDGEGRQLGQRMGVVRQGETTETSEKHPGQSRYPVVAKKPLEMAENRAIWDAFMDAFPLGIERKEV